MKVQLKNYVSVVEVPEGVLFRSGPTNFVLKGSGGLFAVIRKLLNRLDGQVDTESISKEIPEKLRPVFDKLLAKLDAEKMVHHVPDRSEPQLSTAEEALYQQTLRFLANETPYYRSYFAEWRSEPLLVIGCGASGAALVGGLAASGAGQLLVHDCGVETADAGVIGSFPLSDAIDISRDRGFQFSADLIDERVAIETIERGKARLIYCADDLCHGPGGALFERLRLRAGSGSMFAGVFNGRAIVGPRLNASDDSWLDAWQRASANPNTVYPHATLSIIGSLMAFEALKAKLYSDLEGEDKDWERTHFYVVSPAGNISTHAIRPQSVEPEQQAIKPINRNRGEEESRLSESMRLEGGMSTAFDPVAGVLAWADGDRPNFPLPHRSIRIRTNAAPEAVVVTQWGLTPQDARLRAICSAAETYVTLTTEEVPPVPVIAATTELDWRRSARAHALALNGVWRSCAVIRRADPRGIKDPALQMLLRLARLYSEAMPEVCIATVPGCEAAVAGARVGTNVRIAVASDPLTASIAALGNALSAWQRSAATQDQDMITKIWRIEFQQATTEARLLELMDAHASVKDNEFCIAERRIYPPVLTPGPLFLGWAIAEGASR